MEQILHKKFYEYLDEAFQKQAIADLLVDEQPEKELNKNKKKKLKRNRRNKKKAEEA